MSDPIPTMGDSSRSVTSICGPCEYITPIGVRVPHNPLIETMGGIFADSRRYIRLIENDKQPELGFTHQ
jgi:hypothetical protein